MKEYYRVEVVSTRNLNKKLELGWEIIDTTKSVDDFGGSDIHYHIGYPMRKKVNDLKYIISQFEKYGFKEQLINKIAKENKNDIKELEQQHYDYFGSPVVNETTLFMEKYESAVNDKDVRYYQKRNFEMELDEVDF